MDLAKYRTIFIEESTEHFAEISRALLELEKNPEGADSIDDCDVLEVSTPELEDLVRLADDFDRK